VLGKAISGNSGTGCSQEQNVMGHVFQQLPPAHRRIFCEEAMTEALTALSREFYISWDSSHLKKGDDFLLYVDDSKGCRTMIDIVTPRTDEGTDIKSQDILVAEIRAKVQQHLAAVKAASILVSTLGSKYDTSQLQAHACGIDSEGFLLIDQHRVVYNNSFCIQAEQLHSYTILRLIESEGGIHITDEYNSMRSDFLGMFIRCTEVTFEGKACYTLERPTLSLTERTHLHQILHTFPTYL